MKPLSNKKLIISLIKDDLINTRLVNGLNTVGLNADHYLLHLSDTIFKLMGIEETIENEALFEHYIDLLKKADAVDLSESHHTLDPIAEEIYNELCEKLP